MMSTTGFKMCPNDFAASVENCRNSVVIRAGVCSTNCTRREEKKKKEEEMVRRERERERKGQTQKALTHVFKCVANAIHANAARIDGVCGGAAYGTSTTTTTACRRRVYEYS